MADIKPFHGIRYNPAKVSIDKTATKPYDKISPAEQDAYYKADPHNIVRLILGKEQAGDTDTDNRYTRAASFVQQWIRENVFIKEDSPAFYVYDQIFTAPGFPEKKRRALVGLGKVVPYKDKVVFPHEKTLSGPKKDRLLLTRATHCQFGHVFMLYDDKQQCVNTLLEGAIAGTSPVYTFSDSYNVLHMLYIVKDSAVIRKIQAAMADTRLLIADGHHRYETALNFCNEVRQVHPDCADVNYHLMSFVNVYDPGLVILPTHRIVKNLDADTLAQGWSKLQSICTVTKASRADVEPEKLAARKGIVFGAYKDGSYYLITLKDGVNYRASMQKNKPDAWYSLPVAVLHDALLDSLFGIDREKLAAQTNITYVPTVDAGVELVDKEEHQIAFFITPTPIDKVLEISFAGETMPQKTTDFFPKIYTGLVFNKLTIPSAVTAK
ncbi:MAG: DUF1015 domain-containing protein [Candidatus Auribacter fodinae]|jgi:uncharacterized protein (DUF1015 family)|uniref:DUF1015 domain-containing protein n=1 Tax=Candidatus Auribacter fodinae TaxID=2093366 RepID=A0A3A4RBL0_9BACT|nr:MAG: DUF1015 domain-containing protein [Candidatus Auribacter fodinae]